MTATEGQIAESPSSAPASPEQAISLRDAASLTTWLKLLLGCWTGGAVMAFALDWALLHFFEGLQQGLYSAQDGAVLHETISLVNAANFALFFLTAILFLRWVHRANDNARRLGAVGMQFTPGWAIGWYFVPFASLAMPYLVMKETWNASASPADWRSLGGDPIVRWWWGLFVAWNVAASVVTVASFSFEVSVEDTILFARLLMVSDASAIAAGIAALLLVTRLRAIQLARASSN